VGVLVVAVVTDEAMWPFWAALAIIALSSALDWRSRRRRSRPPHEVV
jgi:hypothetical protein